MYLKKPEMTLLIQLIADNFPNAELWLDAISPKIIPLKMKQKEFNEVKNNNPIVAWVTIKFQPARWGTWDFGRAVNNNYAVTLDGYNLKNGTVHVSDPISGKYWINKNTFEKRLCCKVF